VKVEEIQKAAKVVSRVASQNSITHLSRCLEIGPVAIRGYSEVGNVEYGVDIPDLKSACLVNAAAFLAIINSFDPGAELSLELKGDRIAWKCGSAKGHLTLVVLNDRIPVITYNNYPWEPPKEFADALDLASSACQAMTVSVGLYGVVLEKNEGMLRVASSNAMSLASAWVPLNSYPGRDKVTLRPPVPSIIADLLRAAGDSPMMDITSSGVYVLGTNLVAHLPLSAPLSYDLDPILARYTEANHVAKINSGAVQKFLGRSKALADKGTPFLVTIRITEGQIVLEQSSVAAASEQYFLADGLGVGTKEFSSVALSGELMATSLGHIQEVVLDYLEGNTLVFRGTEPKFKHVIGGAARN